MLREKSMKLVVLFHTTTEAMAADRYFTQNAVPGRLIPVPSEISAGCGMCWSVPAESGMLVEEAIKKAGLSFEKTYELLL
ncbi:MAG: DUF3343 domain-containing protein [Johnsonella sp.]|nr:DUF3343 domain-containing protein [Johnsonella sp.]